ncbi:aquaporin [bacterium]|nr:MAG: aquaporin [bacterium]
MTTKSAVLTTEIVGTFLLASVVLAGLNPAIAYGALAVLFGALSGSHLNPAASTGLAVVNRFSPTTMLWYWAAQIIGAVAAKWFYNYLQPVSSDLTWKFATFTSYGFMTEVIGTAILVLGIIIAMKHKYTGIALGVTVGGAYYLGSIWGGTINPAVALATNQISFATLFGPLVGAALGGWLGQELAGKIKPVKA